MNLTNLAASLREEMTTIEVRFIVDGEVWPNKNYLYKCDRTIAETLQQGDMVVVHAQNHHNFKETTLAVVYEVHDIPDIDLDSKTTLKWVMCKVPRDEALDKQLTDQAVGKKLRLHQNANCRERALGLLGLSSQEAAQLMLEGKNAQGTGSN